MTPNLYNKKSPPRLIVLKCMIFNYIRVVLINLGEPIQPTKVDDVTMLFSDIVGFTAICATCTPMMVVNMLNSLYTQFDHYCGMLDVYKVLSQI